LLIVALVLTLSVFSQQVEKMYVGMPDRLNPTMTKKIRLELLEYYKVGQGDSILNRFGRQAKLEVFDTLNNRIVVKNTGNSTFEMKLFYLKQGVQMIGIINTVCAPICMSSVEFYDTAWSKIPLQFTMPKATKWLNNEKLATATDLDKTWLVKALENDFISLQFNNQNQLIARNNSLEFLSEKDRKIISPYVKTEPIVLELSERNWIIKP